jgi:hypothetical protein
LGIDVIYYPHLIPPKYNVVDNAENVIYGRIINTEVTNEVIFKLQNVEWLYNSSENTNTA